MFSTSSLESLLVRWIFLMSIGLLVVKRSERSALGHSLYTVAILEGYDVNAIHPRWARFDIAHAAEVPALP
jgi:hypothetical protein